MSVPRPQDTGCTSIEVEAGTGVANGFLSFIASMRKVEYDEEQDVYIVGEPNP